LIRASVVTAWRRLKITERRELRRRSTRASDAVMRCRCKVILALVQGKTPTMIANGGLCAKSQVYRIAGRFLEHGTAGLADRREDNGPNKVDEAYERRLLEVLGGSPQDHGYRRPTWTQELLISVLAERTEVDISVSTMSRLLRRLGVRLGRPKPIVGCPWSRARRARRLRAIRRLIEGLGPDDVVVYVDEVDIHLNPKTGPDWMRRGRQKTVLTPGCNEKRYLAGALDPKTHRLTWVEGDQKNSLLFLRLLYELVTRTYPKARWVHVVLDNFGIHDSQQVRLALKSERGSKVKLHFLPPYCPDHNRIERVWKDLHDNVTRNHRCAGMEELMIEVRNYLQTRNRHRRHAYAKGNVA
jgi:transposase